MWVEAGRAAKPSRATIVHSSGQGALIKTHCLYSLQQASSRPRCCSLDVHPRHPRPSQLHSQGFSLFFSSLRPTSFLPSKSFRIVPLSPSLSLSREREGYSFTAAIPFLRAIPCFLAKTFLVKEERRVVGAVFLDCLSRKQRTRLIFSDNRVFSHLERRFASEI